MKQRDRISKLEDKVEKHIWKEQEKEKRLKMKEEELGKCRTHEME